MGRPPSGGLPFFRRTGMADGKGPPAASGCRTSPGSWRWTPRRRRARSRRRRARCPPRGCRRRPGASRGPCGRARCRHRADACLKQMSAAMRLQTISVFRMLILRKPGRCDGIAPCWRPLQRSRHWHAGSCGRRINDVPGVMGDAQLALLPYELSAVKHAV